MTLVDVALFATRDERHAVPAIYHNLGCPETLKKLV
jgi:hypothetical protein